MFQSPTQKKGEWRGFDPALLNGRLSSRHPMKATKHCEGENLSVPFSPPYQMAFERTSLNEVLHCLILSLSSLNDFNEFPIHFRIGNRVTATHDQYLLPVVGFAPNITALSEVIPHYTAGREYAFSVSIECQAVNPLRGSRPLIHGRGFGVINLSINEKVSDYSPPNNGSLVVFYRGKT